jgi:hypothetical protein
MNNLPHLFITDLLEKAVGHCARRNSYDTQDMVKDNAFTSGYLIDKLGQSLIYVLIPGMVDRTNIKWSL